MAKINAIVRTGEATARVKQEGLWSLPYQIVEACFGDKFGRIRLYKQK
jgi:hypothetical protein